MSLIQRQILTEAELLAKTFRAISIIGPRQSGKTSLSKQLFSKKPYINLENPQKSAEVAADIPAFLSNLKQGAILDEVQRVPEIFRFLQEVLDERKERASFILTGSNNFLIQEHISQSLAGRIGYMQLLPLSYSELTKTKHQDASLNKLILHGGYPEIWDQEINPSKWMSAYVQTYVQRDVRLVKNILNLTAFNRFVQLCANCAGQILNREELGRTLGIDTKTVQSWLGVLESSYIIFQLQPWQDNINKRLIKSPKIYFYDTGLLCYMLGITSEKTLKQHTMYGNIFEN